MECRISVRVQNLRLCDTRDMAEFVNDFENQDYYNTYYDVTVIEE